MVRHGFSLIELVVYCALVAVIMGMLGDLVVVVLKKCTVASKDTIALDLAGDVWRRDAAVIESDVTLHDMSQSIFCQYHVNENNMVISQHVCWYVRDGRLVRKVGREPHRRYCHEPETIDLEIGIADLKKRSAEAMEKKPL